MHFAFIPAETILLIIIAPIIGFFILGFFIGKKSGYRKGMKETENRNKLNY